METKISKIQFRQDTQANWDISSDIPSKGEPCYVLDNGIFKIGDGEHTFKELPTQSTPKDTGFLTEPIDDGNSYARKREPNEKIGEWVLIPSLDKRKTLNDLIVAEPNTELDMNYTININGEEKEVYGSKITSYITAEAEELVETTLKTNISKLILTNGIINSDNHHNYILPINTTEFTANILLDEENGALRVISKSNNRREESLLELYIIYTKN